MRPEGTPEKSPAMSLTKTISKVLKQVPIIGPQIKKAREAQIEQEQEEAHWKFRIENTLSCPDNEYIPRVEDAGKIYGDQQVMHNGIRIVPGSYHGNKVSLQLEKNKGVHEPEEERVFQEVLKFMPEGATMLELGAYWGFYSMWFQKEVPNALNYLIEPDPTHLEFGKNNLALNSMKGDIHQAYIDEKSGSTEDGTPVISVDDFMQLKGIEKLHMLHSDIQGFERKMLEGARKAFENKAIDYVFISTHRAHKFGHDDINHIHDQCLDFFRDYDFFIIAETDLETTYSWDGLIAARRNDLSGPNEIDIAKRPYDTLSA